MDIIFNQIAKQYTGNEFPEGSYRLEGIGKIGREANPEIDGISLTRLIHSDAHVRQVEKIGARNGSLAEVHMDSEAFQSAVNSVKLAWNAALNGDFACTRPPGHHATANISKGFCLFNNMAIVAQALVNDGKKVCIIDIDGHHGDGTEQIFYSTDQVLFFSIHQEFVYPYFAGIYHSGNELDHTVDRHGDGIGEGYTWNIPVPAISGDDILTAFISFILPKIRDFDPDAIGISAGFDGYFKDSLLDLSYSQHGFYEAGKLISELSIHTFSLLEGGYHRDVVECIRAFVGGINNGEYYSEQDATTSDAEATDRFQKCLTRVESG